MERLAELDEVPAGMVVKALHRPSPMRPGGAWPLTAYDAIKMTARARASSYDMRKKLAYAIQASASYRRGWKQMHTSTIGRFKAAIQDAAKPEEN